MAEVLDGRMVVQRVERSDVPVHQVHIRLAHRIDLLGIVGLHEDKPTPPPTMSYQTADLIGEIRARFVLLQDTPPHVLEGCRGAPRVHTVPDHDGVYRRTSSLIRGGVRDSPQPSIPTPASCGDLLSSTPIPLPRL